MTSAAPDVSTLTLLAVRLRSRGTAESLSNIVAGLMTDPVVDLTDVLSTLAARGLIRARGETRSFSLTPLGSELLDAEMMASTDDVGRAAVADVYKGFLPLNRDFLSTVSAWQRASRSSHDEAAAMFGPLVDEMASLLIRLCDLMPRFCCYIPRITEALDRAKTDSTWIDSPSGDSVHTVWFEIHEHLLATLGLSRTGER